VGGSIGCGGAMCVSIGCGGMCVSRPGRMCVNRPCGITGGIPCVGQLGPMLHSTGPPG